MPPSANVRMVRSVITDADPIFFLGATDTKNRLDAGKHCRTWIEVNVPPAEAALYLSRVDIALVSPLPPLPVGAGAAGTGCCACGRPCPRLPQRAQGSGPTTTRSLCVSQIRSASTDETMAVIPEELIDRVSLNPNALPTEAEARDGVQVLSEKSMCRFWAVPKDRTRQQWLPTICLSMQRAVGFGTRNAQRKTGQRRATGRAAVMCVAHGARLAFQPGKCTRLSVTLYSCCCDSCCLLQVHTIISALHYCV